MTAYAARRTDWGGIALKVVAFIVIVLGILAALYIFFMKFANAQLVAMSQGDTGSAAGWFVIFGIVAFVAAIVIGAIAADQGEKPWLGWVVLSLCACLFSAGGMVWLNSMDHQVRTEPGLIRITQGGAVVPEGETVLLDRYQRTSLNLPAAFSRTYASIHVPLESGESVIVGIEIGGALVANDALGTLVVGNWEDALGQGSMDDRESQREFLATQATLALAPLLTKLVQEAERNQVSVNGTALLLRLGVLMREDPSSVPAWISRIDIRSVDIQGMRYEK